MKNERTFLIRGLLAMITLLLGLNDVVFAEAIDTGLFTQNRLRQCSSDTACIGGDPTLQNQADFDPSVTGSVATLVIDAGLGAQAATSIGYVGVSLTPALSAYAYTAGPQRFTLASFGFQRYEFLEDGDVTFGATLTYSHSGEISPTESNSRGILIGSVMGFQMDGDVFDPENCNLFPNVNSTNAAGFIISCLTRNGQELFPGGPIFDFVGLQDIQVSEFNVPTGPVTDGVATAELTLSGLAGDVFFLGASLGGFAHLGGFFNSSNTLLIDVDHPALVHPTFVQETFVAAPSRSVDIDIKPGSDQNCLNINGRGKIPVAILGSGDFDVLDIDQTSLTFGGLDVAMRRKRGPQCNHEYSNGDDLLDLVCKFQDDAENWSPDSDTEASLEGRLIDGRPISGTDSICLVP